MKIPGEYFLKSIIGDYEMLLSWCFDGGDVMVSGDVTPSTIKKYWIK